MKTLVMNIDETLVHSKFGKFEDANKFFSFRLGTEYFAISIYKRPYLDKFLEYAFKHFEVVFYTTSIFEYASKVIDLLDPQNLAVGTLFRDSCLVRDELFIKTIDRLQREPSEIIMLDNNPLTV